MSLTQCEGKTCSQCFSALGLSLTSFLHSLGKRISNSCPPTPRSSAMSAQRCANAPHKCGLATLKIARTCRVHTHDSYKHTRRASNEACMQEVVLLHEFCSMSHVVKQDMAGQKKCHMCRVACHCVRQKQLAHLAAAQASIRVAHSPQHHLHLFQRPCRLPCCQRAVPACVQPDMCGHWTQVCSAQLAKGCTKLAVMNQLETTYCWQLSPAADCCCTSAVCSYKCTKHGVVQN